MTSSHCANKLALLLGVAVVPVWLPDCPYTLLGWSPSFLSVCEQISWVFHTIMFLASLYLAMLISNWGMLEK